MSNAPISSGAGSGLAESEMHADPIAQFARWYDAVESAQLAAPNAMALATASAVGVPSVRVVLLKGYGADGFSFFTSYDGRKARDLDENPRAALLFFWPQLERQLRVEGVVTALPAAESDAYFQTRPRDSRIGAWASPQSEVIPDRAFLEASFARFASRFGDADIPRPPNWGGYRLVPASLEFWQARDHRLHDRLRYRRNQDRWMLERLAP